MQIFVCLRGAAEPITLARLSRAKSCRLSESHVARGVPAFCARFRAIYSIRKYSYSQASPAKPVEQVWQRPCRRVRRSRSSKLPRRRRPPQCPLSRRVLLSTYRGSPFKGFSASSNAAQGVKNPFRRETLKRVLTASASPSCRESRIFACLRRRPWMILIIGINCEAEAIISGVVPSAFED